VIVRNRRDAVKKREARKRCHQKSFAVLSFVLIFAITGIAADKDSWDSSSTGEEAGREKLDFALDLTPVNSQIKGQLELSRWKLSDPPPMESRHFVMPDKAAELSPNKNRRVTPGVSKLQDSLYTTSLITLTALNVGDYLSTLQALKHKGLEERNPIMQPFTKNIYLFTAIKLGVTAFDVFLLKNLYKKNKPLAWILSTATNFAMSYVVANNIKMIQEIR
jgi:hypothetical protein